MNRAALQSCQRQQGQALTEFALVVPLLVLLLFGIIQFGFLLGGQSGLTSAAREAARYATTYQVTDFSARATNVRTDLVNNILPHSVFGYRSSQLVAANTTVVYCAYANGDNTVSNPSYSLRVKVTIQYRHPIFIPIISNIVDLADGMPDGAMTATVSEGMRMETLRITPPFPTGVSTCV